MTGLVEARSKHRTPAFAASLFVGLLAFCIAKEAGVPVWRDWEVGDASDMGVLAFMAAHFTFRFAAAIRGEGL